MTADDVRRQDPALLGKMHFFTAVEVDEALAPEPTEHLRDGRRGDTQKGRQAGADDTRAFVGERVDGLEIFLDRGRAVDC